MVTPLARVASLAVLCLACAPSKPSTSSEQQVSPPSEPAPAADAAPSVEKVCEHVWALLSAEYGSAGEPGGFESYMDRCVANVEAERLEIGEDEYASQAECVLAARAAAELEGCDPESEPGSPPEPAQVETTVDVSIPAGAIVMPLSELMDHAMYTPNPDPEDIQQTKAARFDKADGVSVVAFCVEPNGKTSHIRTKRKFPGDPMIDEILRNNVAKWRFKPFVRDGVAVRVCSEKSYKLKFR